VGELASGGAASDIASASEFATALEQLPLERSSTEFDRNVITEIFELAKPTGEAITHTATLANGDLLAIRLDSVDVPDVIADDADEPSHTPGTISAGADARRGSVEFEILLESLRGNADVDILPTATAASSYP